MKCFLCKGDMINSTTTYMTTYNNCYIIIKMYLAKNATNVAKNILMALLC